MFFYIMYIIFYTCCIMYISHIIYIIHMWLVVPSRNCKMKFPIIHLQMLFMRKQRFGNLGKLSFNVAPGQSEAECWLPIQCYCSLNKLNKARLDYKHTRSSLNVCNILKFDMTIKLSYGVQKNIIFSNLWAKDDNFSVVQLLDWSKIVWHIFSMWIRKLPKYAELTFRYL